MSKNKAHEAEIEAAVAAWIDHGGVILRVPPPAPVPARPTRPYKLHPLHIPGGRSPVYHGGTPWAEEWDDPSECQPDWY